MDSNYVPSVYAWLQFAHPCLCSVNFSKIFAETAYLCGPISKRFLVKIFGPKYVISFWFCHVDMHVCELRARNGFCHKRAWKKDDTTVVSSTIAESVCTRSSDVRNNFKEFHKPSECACCVNQSRCFHNLCRHTQSVMGL